MKNLDVLKKLLPATDSWPHNEQIAFQNLVSFVANAETDIRELREERDRLKKQFNPKEPETVHGNEAEKEVVVFDKRCAYCPRYAVQINEDGQPDCGEHD